MFTFRMVGHDLYILRCLSITRSQINVLQFCAPSDDSCFLKLLHIFDNSSDSQMGIAKLKDNLLRMIILVTYVTCQKDLTNTL